MSEDSLENKAPHLRLVTEGGEVRTPQQIFEGAARRVGTVLLKTSLGQSPTQDDIAELIRIQGELGNINEGDMDERLKIDVKNLMEQARELEKANAIDNL